MKINNIVRGFVISMTLHITFISTAISAEKGLFYPDIRGIRSDMLFEHEGHPHGVSPTVGWYSSPRVRSGNTPPNGFHSITAWGQIFEAEEGSPARNARVEIRDIMLFLIRKSDSGVVCLQSALAPEGAAYAEEYTNNINRRTAIRSEPEGSISVTVGGGWNFHFWPHGPRPDVDPSDIAGIVTVFFARLILDDPNRVDDRASANIIASAGADYWLDRSAQWDKFKTNREVGIGRFKYVTQFWQQFAMTSSEDLPDLSTAKISCASDG